MALETWLVKVKTAISNGKPKLKIPTKKSNIGVLAFEIAGIMTKLLHLWKALSDKNIVKLRNESISLEGVRKIVSDDESFLLRLACAELLENIRHVAKSISRLSKRCEDSNLRSFERLFEVFADSGKDTLSWILSGKDMETRNKKMDRYVVVTTTLYKEMEELSILENSLRKSLISNTNNNSEYDSSLSSSSSSATSKEQRIIDLQQKIIWQKQEVKYLKERSLWNRSFDTVVSLLVKPTFTILARMKLVFGINNGGVNTPSYLPRSLSASATVHPTDHQNPNSCNFVSGPLKSPKSLILDEKKKDSVNGFFESNSKLLKAPSSTLGASALSLHYANLIIVMEKMIKSPQLVGVDARDDLYSMLPRSIRSSLRERLRGVGFTASDPVLAGEWRNALGRILAWLSPMAHNMIKWQSERSYEQQNLVRKNNNVLLLQTLYFANKEKTEAAITELLVGLNYIWRFEREMTAKAFLECANNMNINIHNNNFHGLFNNNNLHNSS